MFAEIKSKLSKIVKFDRETIVRVCISLVLGLVSIVYFATHFTGAVFGILLFVLLSFVTIEPRASRVFVEDIVLPWYVSIFTCYYFQLACIYGHEWFGNPGIFSVHLLYDGRLFFEIPVIFAVFFLLRTCTLSPRISAMLTPLPFMVLMLTNYFVYSFRGHEIVCEDLVSAKTALSVAGEYTYPLEIPVFFMLLPYVLFILSLWGIKGKVPLKLKEGQKADYVLKPLPRQIFLFLLTCFFVVMQMILAGVWFNTDKWEGRENCHTYTAWGDNPSSLVGFYLNFVKSVDVMNVRQPDGYSRSALDTVINTAYTNYKVSRDGVVPTSEGVMPNIIVIMNESYSDLGIYGDLAPAKDPDPYWDRLTEDENCIGGYCYTSVYGGNTPNSEFEFLTGLSLYFLPSSTVPFNTVLRDTPVRNLVTYVEEMGYTSLAMHPAPAGNWNRQQVYPMLGFDQSMFIEDFSYTEDDLVNGWISDSCAYTNLIAKIDEQEEAGPFFDFLVTTQNHGGYAGEYKGSDIYYEANPALGIDAARAEELNNFCSRIALSDKALEMLINELSTRSERYILVIYGDHQPSCAPVSSADFDKGGLAYVTPYRIWANYSIKTEEAQQGTVEIAGLDNATSLNYLSLNLLDALGFEYDSNYAFLSSERDAIPIVNQAGPLTDPEADAANAERMYSYYVYAMLYDEENQ